MASRFTVVLQDEITLDLLVVYLKTSDAHAAARKGEEDNPGTSAMIVYAGWHDNELDS